MASGARPRVVVADDHPDVLQRVIALLGPHFEIAAAVATGDAALDAVRELSPDLVMLDISMPGLSGFEIAAHLQADGHPARIALMSAVMSDDFVAAGLRVGVRGFVAKARMRNDLVDALNHVSQRRAFLPTLSSFSSTVTAAGGCHAMQICADRDDRLTAAVSYFLSAWRDGHVLLAVGPIEDLAVIAERLAAAGLDLPLATAEGRYAAVDVHAGMAAVLRDGHLDAKLFAAMFSPLVDRLSGPAGRHICASGAIAPVLCAEGRYDNALEAEQLSHAFACTRRLSILCPWTSSETRALGPERLTRLHAAHATIVSPA